AGGRGTGVHCGHHLLSQPPHPLLPRGLAPLRPGGKRLSLRGRGDPGGAAGRVAPQPSIDWIMTRTSIARRSTSSRHILGLGTMLLLGAAWAATPTPVAAQSQGSWESLPESDQPQLRHEHAYV